MHRILASLVAAVVVLTHAAAGTASAAPPRVAPNGPDLKAMLETGLRPQLPQEFAFVAYVVARVQQGTLPQSLVESTFLWARDQKQPYPFPYFERGLKVRARKLGITL